jgi:flagellar P-ring protein precursor FlgI
MSIHKQAISRVATVAAALLVLGTALVRPVMAERIRDVTRLKNEGSNEIVGYGLVIGLDKTGDGNDFPASGRALVEMLKRLNNDVPVASEHDLRDAKNIALVTLSVIIPPQGVHAHQKLDVKVSAIAAKNLEGGNLFITPLLAPIPDRRIIIGRASGKLKVDDTPTTATIHDGAIIERDLLPDEINDSFTLVLTPTAANPETATAIADQINEEVRPQTGGKAVATAVDATSVVVTIPPEERANPTPFIARIQGRLLPDLPVPATITVDMQQQTMAISDEVELAPGAMALVKNLSIVVDSPAEGNGATTRPGTLNSATQYAGNAKVKDLVNAFDALHIPFQDRVAVIKQLSETHLLRGKLVIVP